MVGPVKKGSETKKHILGSVVSAALSCFFFFSSQGMEETLKITPSRIAQGQLIAAFFLQANVMSLTGGNERQPEGQQFKERGAMWNT